jgi:excisionase family DNA binding protein
VKQVAHLLGLSTAAVYRSVERNEIPHVRLLPHGAITIPRSVLDHERKVRTS